MFCLSVRKRAVVFTHVVTWFCSAWIDGPRLLRRFILGTSEKFRSIFTVRSRVFGTESLNRGTVDNRNRETYVVAGILYSREEIVHRYLHLVKYVAGRISTKLPANVDLDDLINDGVIGLIDAVEKYEDGRNVKFETYAITRIHGSIVDALRSLDWVPRWVRAKSREHQRVVNDFEARHGYVPSDAEVALVMGMSRDDYDVMLSKIRGSPVFSLEDSMPSDRGDSMSLSDGLASRDEHVGFDMENEQIRELLISAIQTLPVQERIVIQLYYFETQSLKQIHVVLGVSESRVSQIHARAVVHLRQKLSDLAADVGHRENDPTVRRKYVRRSPSAFVLTDANSRS